MFELLRNLITLLINLLCELGQIMTRDDFIWLCFWICVMFEPTWSNFFFANLSCNGVILSNVRTDPKNEISSLLINLLIKCLPHNDHVTDLEQCLNRVLLDLSPLFVNLSHELAQTMTRYYCLGTEQYFWAMFELTPTLPNFTFGQMFKQIGTRYTQIWHTDNYGCDFEPCLS